jgi:transglutaminase-like putative cysteine protease
MKLRVSHLSRYEYSQSVSFSPHMVYLRPRETAQLRLSRFTLNISPNAKVTHTRDCYENTLTWLHFWDRASALSIRTEIEIENTETNPFDFLLRHDAVKHPFSYDPYERYILTSYLLPPDPKEVSMLESWLNGRVGTGSIDTVPFLSQLNRAVFESLSYEHRTAAGIQDATTTIATGKGSCRDYANLLIALCRLRGIAARFVSGYVYTGPEDNRHTPNAMHAWVEVYLPGAGWKGLDPTHGIFCADTYVPVAHAPNGYSVSPVQGSYYSAVRVPSTLTTSVLVEAI